MSASKLLYATITPDNNVYDYKNVGGQNYSSTVVMSSLANSLKLS